MITDKFGKRPYLLALVERNLKNAELLREYEPNRDCSDEKIVKKLPSDLLNFLKKGNLKVDIPNLLGIKYVEFLSITDLTVINFGEDKGIFFTKGIDNYPGIYLLWNMEKKCVSYFEEEHGWYGDLGVSF